VLKDWNSTGKNLRLMAARESERQRCRHHRGRFRESVLRSCDYADDDDDDDGDDYADDEEDDDDDDEEEIPHFYRTSSEIPADFLIPVENSTIRLNPAGK